MSWLASLLIAVLSAALGLVGTGVVCSACVKWYRISSFEGGSGYFVFFTSLLGGAAAFVIGFIIARMVESSSTPGFLRGLLTAWGSIALLTGIAALLCYLFADIPPQIQGRKLMLEVELRFPVGAKSPLEKQADKSSFRLSSIVDHKLRRFQMGELHFDRVRQEDGRWILPASVPLFTSRGKRAIDFELPGESFDGFLIPLPAKPGHEHEQWSDWGPRGMPDHPWPDTKPSYRIRVARIEPPPPPPTAEETKAKVDAEENAKFEAIPADAPIQDWFPYTRYGAPDERRDIAIRNITAKPGYAAELRTLMLASEYETATEAIRIVTLLPDPTDEVVATVSEVGRDIIVRMQNVNATTVEQDPSYQGAADASVRFSSWISAVRALREKSRGDFIPQLREMLELSRVRSDSITMRDVRRIASYYAHQWAGIEPLPGDPPPK